MDLFYSYVRSVVPVFLSVTTYINMFNRFKNAVYSAVGVENIPSLPAAEDAIEGSKTPKFPYTRPHFLQFHTEEEINVSADHSVRPIIVPRDISKLEWNAGYAETVNAGKSEKNEDQACCIKGALLRVDRKTKFSPKYKGAVYPSTPEREGAHAYLPYVYFALFDGHAGYGAAVAAANQLHHIVHEKLVDIIDHLLPPLDEVADHHFEASTKGGVSMWFPEKAPSVESLIIGALEASFWEMDQMIAEDRVKYVLNGGCTALVALFILGKLYVANAGDSRAVLCKDWKPIPLSFDFTPENERERVRHLAALQPELLGRVFTQRDYFRRPTSKDIGKRVLYREAHMTGWAYKTVTKEDLRFPVVYGEGKRSRVLATIGVTRGFGDHDLKAIHTTFPIKPFLSSQPQVIVYDIENESVTDSDVLIMGTDGLWDVTDNEKATEIVKKSLDHFPADVEPGRRYRYTSAAQDLVMHSRGKLTEGSWVSSENKAGTIDDISVFVIPLLPYKESYQKWKVRYKYMQELYERVNDPAQKFGSLSLDFSTSPARKKTGNKDSEKLDEPVANHFDDDNQSVSKNQSGFSNDFDMLVKDLPNVVGHGDNVVDGIDEKHSKPNKQKRHSLNLGETDVRLVKEDLKNEETDGPYFDVEETVAATEDLERNESDS
ncbi:protein phosphatase 1H [Ischnura elegans]|uniref:protein phosphatase 1H n=1 Tax=Ischnura elegans TaxID=197161 RepID=UPI001ED885E3|nr:protein phosphatase 1H [Ischnura elegans]XP_046405296.1 protein phosphatase 1H [Ischnura elegans]